MSDDTVFRDPGEVPVLDWIDKDLIDVDPTYQRELDEARVQRILDWFDWRSFGALVVTRAANGRYNTPDGQHRLEAAKRHPKISVVPAVIVGAETTAEEAEVFVGINRDRKNVSPLQLYWAELAANDPEAQTVAQVCEKAGVSIIRSPGGQTRSKPGDTVAITVIRGLIERRGALKARQMLEVLAKAELAPIGALAIRAVEILMTDPEFCNEIDAEGLTESIGGKSMMLEDEARAFGATHRMPMAKAMASVWFKKTRKRRKAAPVDPPEMTRGQALRQAEARETPEMADRERKASEQSSGELQRLADIAAAFGTTPKETKLLQLLTPGRIMSRAALHAAIYSDDIDGGPDDKIIDVLVSKLRPKLGDHSVDIQTIRGMGYQFTGEMLRRFEAVVRQKARETT